MHEPVVLMIPFAGALFFGKLVHVEDLIYLRLQPAGPSPKVRLLLFSMAMQDLPERAQRKGFFQTGGRAIIPV